ncbi:hypothetical protein MYX76_18500, partial [Desulfobacterota bacterium AH_259_B03_O07]|nr:hypothetical protein [Desulfobacterota bacterium AH_259_B03_O07]
MIMYRRISWWYWLASSVLLTIGLFVWFPAFYILIALSAVQVFHYSIRDNSITSFPVQVRIAYLIWMVVALWEPLRFLYWIPFVGTWAMVLTGYCFLARCMSLLPWNRNEQISLSLLKRTF